MNNYNADEIKELIAVAENLYRICARRDAEIKRLRTALRVIDAVSLTEPDENMTAAIQNIIREALSDE